MANFTTAAGLVACAAMIAYPRPYRVTLAIMAETYSRELLSEYQVFRFTFAAPVIDGCS